MNDDMDIGYRRWQFLVAKFCHQHQVTNILASWTENQASKTNKPNWIRHSYIHFIIILLYKHLYIENWCLQWHAMSFSISKLHKLWPIIKYDSLTRMPTARVRIKLGLKYRRPKIFLKGIADCNLQSQLCQKSLRLFYR